jgi:arsenate reductase
MEEAGISMADHKPKLLTDIPDTLDILITMGCNVVCPYVPSSHSEDWGLEDPSGGPIEDYRVTRDLIKDKVLDLEKRVISGEIVIEGIND